MAEYSYSNVDKEWIDGKRGIIGENGEFVTLKTIGDKIKQFAEDVRLAKEGKYIPKKVIPRRDFNVDEFIESLDK